VQSDRIAIVQSLSGTGALRVGGDFLKRFWKNKTIYLPTPTWPNHNGVFNACDLKVKQYRYYSPEKIGFNAEGMLEDLNAAEEGSVVLLHACAHNPTGTDPSQEDWKKIAKLVQERGLLVFFDAAYLGFASGDYDDDAFPIRYFVEQGITLLLAVSFAKNMVRILAIEAYVGIIR
jgi:aspartate aminotransferase, mitochondrial